jgi:putative membrane protein
MVASRLLTPEDRQAVSRAVAEAERKTSGEIVPVVAAASDRYERAEDTFGLWLALVAVSAVWIPFMGVRPATGEWESGWELSLPLVYVLAIFVAAWVLGVFLAARFPFLKRLAASRSAMRARVERRAEDSFLLFHVRGTRAATGIVLYVSLFEHLVCVKADRAIAEKVPAAEWKAICEGMMRALRRGSCREAFLEAIGRCGELLARHFPPRPGDVNELANELRVLD